MSSSVGAPDVAPRWMQYTDVSDLCQMFVGCFFNWQTAGGSQPVSGSTGATPDMLVAFSRADIRVCPYFLTRPEGVAAAESFKHLMMFHLVPTCTLLTVYLLDVTCTGSLITRF